MALKYKKEIFNRIISRAETSIYFVEDFLYHHSAKDGAYFRSVCILISYGFELALKARVISLSLNTEKTELEKELIDLNHKILDISKKLGDVELNKIGIKSIANKNTDDFISFTIKTINDNEFYIENFTDIRYDFFKDSLRTLPENETVSLCIKEILNIINNIKKLS